MFLGFGGKHKKVLFFKCEMEIGIQNECLHPPWLNQKRRV